MSEVEFKVGDKVYCLIISTKIGEIVDVSTIENDSYFFKVVVDDNVIIVPKDGKFTVNAPAPVIYQATQENYEWLSATFPNVEFEQPPNNLRKE